MERFIDQPATADKPDGRRERGRARRRAMIEAARELFIAQGYRGTTLEAIIARAGGSRETIYREFGGKHGLFAAVVAESGEALAESIVTPATLTLPPREELTRLGHQLAAIWRSDEGRAINRVVVAEGLDAPDLLDAWYKSTVLLSVSALSRYLDVQVDAGRLQALNSELVARQFVVLMMGELAYPLIAGSAEPADLDDQIARCVDLILRAYES